MEHWDELRVFLAAYRAGSCAAASQKLGLNQSTVSRRLSALETELGVRLFERVPGGLLPTTAAAEVLVQAERIESATNHISAVVAGLDHRLVGSVRVALPDQVATEMVAPALPAFFQEHPGLHLQLTAGSEIRDLTRREADLALRFVRPVTGDLMVKKIATMRFAVYGHARYLRANKSVPCSELAWLDWNEEFSHLPDAAWRHKAYPMVVPLLRTSSLGARLRALLAGVGVAVLATSLAKRYPELEAVDVASALPALPVWLVQHPALYQLPRIKAVSEFLTTLAEDF